MKKLAFAFLPAVVMISPAWGQDAHALLTAADQAMGASKVNSISYTGTGMIANMGQNYAVTDDWPRMELQSWSQVIDYPSKSSKEDQVRVQGKYPARGGGAPYPIPAGQHIDQHLMVSGNFAWAVNAQGQPQPQNGQADLRQFLIWTTPHGFIKAALADPKAAISDREFVATGHNVRVVGFNVGRYRVTGEINDQNLLERVITWIPNAVMGDMQVEIRYSDWRDIGNGIKAPFHIHEHRGDHPLVRGMNFFDVQSSGVQANVQNAALTVPDAVRNAPRVPPEQLKTTKVSDGVWEIGANDYNSVAVEMKDFIVLVEAPETDAQTNAVMAEAKRLIPGKQIKYVINTHHHWDHSGGIRAAYAEGSTIVTNEMNRDFFERVVLVPQSRTLNPDRLSLFPFATTGPGPGKLETYRERYTISDGDQTVICYHIPNTHATDMAIVYLPKQKILINGDMWRTPAPGSTNLNPGPNTVALYNAIHNLKLDVKTHVGIHGVAPAPDDVFEKMAAPLAAKQQRPGGDAG